MLLRKKEVKLLICAYFADKDPEQEAELLQLIDDLPMFNMQRVREKLEGKRYWDALNALESGWE